MVDPFQILDNVNTSSSNVSSESVETLMLNKKMNDNISNENFSIKLATTSIQNSTETDQINNKSLLEAKKNDQQKPECIMGGSSSSQSNIVLSQSSSCIDGDNNSSVINSTTNCLNVNTICNDDKTISENSEQNLKNNLKQIVYKSNSTNISFNTTTSNTIVVQNHYNAIASKTIVDEVTATANKSVCSVSEKQLSTVICNSIKNDYTNDKNISVADNVISNTSIIKINNLNNEYMHLNLNNICTVNSADNKIESQKQSTIIQNIMDENSSNSDGSRPTSTSESSSPIVDNRKVEPLKINLHRDPIILKLPKSSTSLIHENCVDAAAPPPPAIPKITIKQIPKTATLSQAASIVNSTTSAAVIVSSDNTISTATTTVNHKSAVRLDDYKVIVICLCIKNYSFNKYN